jgi:hypothetical protein
LTPNNEDTNNRYPYLTTWLGEHQNESDMAFYSTQPFEHIVGPGIGRAEYGGLLMTLPPRRLYDVWTDPDYDMAETKAERLLMAALDYSTERHVVYVAAKTPRSIFRQLAARTNRKSSISRSANSHRQSSKGFGWFMCSTVTKGARKPDNTSGNDVQGSGSVLIDLSVETKVLPLQQHLTSAAQRCSAGPYLG